jgi:tetratricopeptide (TPR) repeat protein
VNPSSPDLDTAFRTDSPPSSSGPTETSAETRIQTEPAAAGQPTREDAIPLPPLKVKRAPLSPERLAAEIKLLDRVLVGILLVLAFLLGSFAVQNNDFWMHLATGRLIAQGDYTFGDNPYSHPETGYWANHSWLFDLAIYGLSNLGGGIDSPAGQALLIVARGLVLVALAWVLLLFRRPGQSIWVPVLCTTLALLAVSTRLVYRPTFLTYLFLALTLYLLYRPGKSTDESGRIKDENKPDSGSSFRLWFLPLLFILWVNTDEWYILGPLTVALYLLGEVVQRIAPIRNGPGSEKGPDPLNSTGQTPFPNPDAREPGHLGTLTAVFVLGLLACLASPFHYHGLTVPTDLSYLLVSARDGLDDLAGISLPLPEHWLAAGQTLKEGNALDPRAFPISSSPFGTDTFQSGWEALRVAGFAYYVLLVAGVISFGLLAWSRAAWVWGRFFVWLVFALLSIPQVVNVPFFAVVAAPITALNIQDLVAQTLGTQVRVDGPWKGWSLGGRLATILAGLALVLFTWPGLLHPRPDDAQHSHHVAWHVQPNPVFQATAQQLGQVLDATGPAHAFNWDLDFAAYCAWYCPQEKTFMDRRLALFPDRVKDFVTVRDDLAADWNYFSDHAREVIRRFAVIKGMEARIPPAKKRHGTPAWQKIFRKWQLNHVLHDNMVALYGTWTHPNEWVQPDVGDLSFIAGWKGAQVKAPFKRPPVDMHALAYSPARASRLDPDMSIQEPEEPGFLSRFRQGPAPTPWNVNAALLYHNYATLQAQYWPVLQESWAKRQLVVKRQLAGVTAQFGGGAGWLPRLSAAFVTSRLPDRLLLSSIDTPVSGEAFILAVRSARQAVVDQPRSAPAHLNLAQSYYDLWVYQEETWRRAPANLSFRTMDTEYQYRQTIREAQVAMALNNALTLDPSLVDAHRFLAHIYKQMNYLDSALRHLEEARKYLRAHPPRPSLAEISEVFQRRKETYTENLKRLTEEINTLRTRVNERLKDFRRNAADKRLREKVIIALIQEYQPPEGRLGDVSGRGLADEALKLLLRAKGREMSLETALWQIRLLLTMGRTREVRERLETLENQVEVMKENQAKLMKKEAQRKGQPNITLLRNIHILDTQLQLYEALLAAVTGDYQGAERRLEKFRDQGKKIVPPFMKHWALYTVQELSFASLLSKLPPPPPPRVPGHLLPALAHAALAEERHLLKPGYSHMLRQQVKGAVRRIGRQLKNDAEFSLMSGLLALERGDIDKAAKWFRQTVRQSRDLQFGENAFPDHQIAVRYLQEIAKEKKKAEK